MSNNQTAAVAVVALALAVWQLGRAAGRRQGRQQVNEDAFDRGWDNGWDDAEDYVEANPTQYGLIRVPS